MLNNYYQIIGAYLKTLDAYPNPPASEHDGLQDIASISDQNASDGSNDGRKLPIQCRVGSS